MSEPLHYRKVCVCGATLNSNSQEELYALLAIHRKDGEIHKLWEGR